MIFDRYPDRVMSFISGILIGVSYLQIHLGFLIYVGLVPLIHIWLNRKMKTSLAMTYMSAMIAHFIAFYWMGLNQGASVWVALLSLSGAVLYLSMFWLFTAGVVTWFQDKMNIGLMLFPFVWIAMEFIRSFGSMGFPWGDLALTQVNYLPMIQMADTTGMAGISLVVCFMNGLIYIGLLEKDLKKYGSASAVLWLIVFIFGLLRYNYIEKNSSQNSESVAIIQPNIDPVQKWDRLFRAELISLMDSMTVRSMETEPDLILWPESALPLYLRTSPLRRQFQGHVFASDIPLLAGTVDRTSNDTGNKFFNGSIMLNVDGTIDMYHKIHLVPFAEYTPLSYKFPTLKNLNFGQGNFVHGDEYILFNVGNSKLGTMICYESSFPRIARQFVLNGADILSIQTNDAWSGNSPGAYQHFAIAQLRAVENRVPVIRSANTGISGIIDPSGNVQKKLDFYEQGIIYGSLAFMIKNTHYPTGDIFALLCIFFGIGLIFREWIRKK